MCLKKFFQIVIISILFFSCSKDTNKVSVIEEKSLDLQVLDAYKVGMESLKNGDVLFAAKKFNEAEMLYPQSEVGSKIFTHGSIFILFSRLLWGCYFRTTKIYKSLSKKSNLDYAYYLLANCFYETIVDEKKDLESIINAKKKFYNFNK